MTSVTSSLIQLCVKPIYLCICAGVCDRKAKKLKRVLGDLIIIMFFTRDLFFKCKNSKTHDSHKTDTNQWWELKMVRRPRATIKKSGFSFEIAETWYKYWWENSDKSLINAIGENSDELKHAVSVSMRWCIDKRV